MRLHAQQQAPLATCDLATKRIDVIAAALLDGFDRGSYAIFEIGLGESRGRSSEQSKQRGGHDCARLESFHDNSPRRARAIAK